jgi:hypothetical protein
VDFVCVAAVSTAKLEGLRVFFIVEITLTQNTASRSATGAVLDAVFLTRVSSIDLQKSISSLRL